MAKKYIVRKYIYVNNILKHILANTYDYFCIFLNILKYIFDLFLLDLLHFLV